MAFTERYVSALAGGSGNGLTEGTAYTWAQMLGVLVSNGGGYRYNVKADGVYTRTTYDDSSGATGSAASGPIWIRGYKTVIGDGYLGRDSTGALITTNMAKLTKTGDQWQTPKQSIIESIWLEGNRNDNIFTLTEKTALVACVVSNSSTDGKVMQMGEWAMAFESDLLMTGPTSGREAVEAQSGDIKLDSCRIISTATGSNHFGIKFGQGFIMYGCLVKGNGGQTGLYGWDPDRHAFLRNNIITGWIDAVFFNVTTDRTSLFAGNMITDNSGYAFRLTTGNNILFGPNRLRDNVSGTFYVTSNWTDSSRIIPLLTTDTGGPETDYVDAGSNNYQPVNAAVGIAANVPKYSDLGAYGRQHTVGGGGGTRSGRVRLVMPVIAIGSVTSSSGPSTHPEALDFFSRANITDETQKTAVNTLVGDLKTAGIWTKMRAFYPFIGGNATSHSKNLISSLYGMFWNGSITHSAGGVTGGTDGFGNTNLNINTTTLGSIAFGVYQTSLVADVNRDIATFAGDGTEYALYLDYGNSGTFYGVAGASGNIAASVSGPRGFFLLTRQSTTVYKAYLNGVQLGATATATPDALPNSLFQVLRNANLHTQALAFISDGLSDAECVSLNTAVQSYQTTLGRNV